ncbi:MAG: cohesin domain-containing protein [Patescibacteria group bacterium]
MMKFRYIYIWFIAILLFPISFSVQAQTVNLDASKLVPRVEVFLSPRSGSFVEGATFEAPIIINTKGASINSTEIRVNYDKDKLTIVSSSNGVSIIGIWVEPPKYDNTRGAASYIGVIPNGITTDSGVVGTITFKALRAGRAVVSISTNSKVLLSDGLGTETILDLRRSEYTIIPKAPEGVQIFSETHPFQSSWYNNNSPAVSWDRDPDIQGFSYELDNKPSTIPDSKINTTDTTKSFEKLGDGLWYFHIKANKGGVWGTTGHFLMKIDTTPTAEFKPEVNYVLAATVLVERALISFFTTDNLSGINHYEVGVINKEELLTQSPIFVQSESPFQVPVDKANLRVIVRAVDNAGNIRDASIDVKAPLLITKLITKFLKDYLIYILIFITFVGFLVIYRTIRNLKRARKAKDPNKKFSSAFLPH